MGLKQQIDDAVRRVENLTNLALSGHDGQCQVAELIGAPISVTPKNRRGAAMRCIADRVLPANWDFVVQDLMNGSCAIAITCIREA
jgi:enhancing lycopene biosynthesis protein 2